MQISALKEISTDENRVALTPDAIKLFQRLGLDVLIEDGAGNNSGLNYYQHHPQLKHLNQVVEIILLHQALMLLCFRQ